MNEERIDILSFITLRILTLGLFLSLFFLGCGDTSVGGSSGGSMSSELPILELIYQQMAVGDSLYAERQYDHAFSLYNDAREDIELLIEYEKSEEEGELRLAYFTAMTKGKLARIGMGIERAKRVNGIPATN